MSNPKEQSTAVALARQGAIVATADVMTVGRVLAQSGYFKDARQEAQAVAKVLYGQELGIGPVTAMMSIHIIEGKPAASANLVAARIKTSGRYDYRVREHSAQACVIEFFERDHAGNRETLGIVSWSMDDARAAGLTGRAPWKSYPRAMLFARAITEGARTHCPDVFGGAPVYTPEELGADVDAEGDPVANGSARAPAHKPVTDAKAAGALRELVGDADAEVRAAVEARIEAGMTLEEARAYYVETKARVGGREPGDVGPDEEGPYEILAGEGYAPRANAQLV